MVAGGVEQRERKLEIGNWKLENGEGKARLFNLSFAKTKTQKDG